MLKIFVILLLVFGIVLFGFVFVLRFLKNTFSGMFTVGTGNSRQRKKNEDVLYNNDDVVVLKGEAKHKNKRNANDDK